MGGEAEQLPFLPEIAALGVGIEHIPSLSHPAEGGSLS
jgi:hypothetical protein